MAATQNDKPMSFAIMRNAHEAFRGCFKVMDSLLRGPPEQRVQFLPVFQSYLRSMRVHMDIEDKDMFRLLDEISGGEVSKAGVSSLHGPDEELLEQALKLLPTEDSSEKQWNDFSEAYFKWAKSHEEHFVKEEKIMMPLTQKTAPTAEGRSKAVHNRLIVPAVSRNREDFHFHVSFCVEYLSKYGSTSQNAVTATQVYVRGLKGALTAAEWSSEFLPVCRDACTPEVWSEIQGKCNIESTNDVLSDEIVVTPAPAPTPVPPPAPVVMTRPPRPVPRPEYYDNSGCCTIQ